MITFALIYSPLVGPSTWQLVADYLSRQNHRAILPTLTDSKTDKRPFWEQHAESAANEINTMESNNGCILVGHSGAGPILPLVGKRLIIAPAGYIFVDAGIHTGRCSRLDMMKCESSEWASEFEKYLRTGGQFPNWSESDLLEIIPDDKSRLQVLKEINARDLSFFVEEIPCIDDWSSIPCGYIQFTNSYDVPARYAIQLGWPFNRLEAEHFHMLVEPDKVGNALIQMGEQLVGVT